MVSGSNQSSNRTNLEPPSTNTKSTPSHKSSKFSLDSKPFFRIQNSSHPPRPQLHRKAKTPNTSPKFHPQFALQTIRPKTRENTQALGPHPGPRGAKSPEASRGPAGHAYAPDASSEDPDPRAASSDQSGRAVGRYKSRGANQRLGTPLKNPLASRAH